MKGKKKFHFANAELLNESSARVPLAGSLVAAGFPSPADDYLEKNLDLNEFLVGNPAATFFVRVNGDSMIDAGIHDRDMLVVDRSLEPEAGDVIIAVLEGEMVVKRLKKAGKRVFLMPENPEYPSLEVREEMDFVVWGVVTFVIHPLN